MSEIDLSYFDTKLVTDMGRMFSGCLNLTLLNLENINTSLVESMWAMFYKCSSLTSLDMSKFKTFLVTDMYETFYGCSNLKTLNLSLIDTSLVTIMYGLFFNCSNLIYLDLSNFVISNETNVDKMFSGCSSLNYINFANSKINTNSLDVLPENVMICAEDIKWEEIVIQLNLINNCSYNNIITTYITTHMITNTKINTEYITSKTKNIQLTEKETLQFNEEKGIITIENIINELKNKFNKTYIDSGKDIILDKENIHSSLTNTENQRQNEYENESSIDFGNCEKELKSKYNLSNETFLYIIKLDININGMNIPKTEYEVYYPFYNNETLYQLNLSYCQEKNIDIFFPITINDDIEKYDPNSNYYNDICSKTNSNDGGIDIPLSDRRKKFVNNNMTLCEENCNLIDYNDQKEKVKCSCPVKIEIPYFEDIQFDKEKFYKSFIDIKTFSNLNIVKCYKNVLVLKYLKKNYGFYFYIILFALYIICFILFYAKFYSLLINKVEKIKEAKEHFFKSKKMMIISEK